MTHNNMRLTWFIFEVVKPNASSKWAWKSKNITDRPISYVQTKSKDEIVTFKKL